MKENEIGFSFSGRYFTSGNITPATKNIWIVLHGYGQLAKYFIRKFSVLEAHHIVVIAPEALSHFYLEDVSTRAQTGNQRVGASWMTRENRLADIQNYLAFLDAIYQKEIGKSDANITILGFSQGAATASRWAAQGIVPFHRLILWAGVLPPDMAIDVGKEMMRDKTLDFVFGKADPFLTDSRFSKMKSLCEQLGITPRVTTFEGGHDIDTDTLIKLI